MHFSLNDEEKKFLLKLARTTIRTFLDKGKKPETEYFSDVLKKESGVFVTLHLDGDLRGCIGYVKGFKPLQDAVIEMAISAAFNDPRFAPVSADEFDYLEIEISVLTPLTKITDISEIQIGQDGLLVKQSPYEGLLLPQVATEQNWDLETFLSQTCRKAGLPKSAWQDPETEIFKFSAIIFNEKELN